MCRHIRVQSSHLRLWIASKCITLLYRLTKWPFRESFVSMHYFWRRNHEYFNQSETSSAILNFKLFRKATTICCKFGNWVCISFDAQVAIWHTDWCPTHFDHKSWNENPQIHHCNRISKIVSLMRSLS